MIKRAFNRAAMSISYGKEAADHYGESYPVMQEIRDWFKGFIEALKQA